MNIRWKVTDPLGNEIFLTEKVYTDHICGEHADNDSEVRKNLEDRVKRSIKCPRFIVKAPNCEGRRVYLNLVAIQHEDSVSVRLFLVVVDENNEVVTWFVRRTINDTLTQGDVIYDERNYNLPL